MGLFSKKTVVGDLVADHYDSGEVVVDNPLPWVETVMVFALYLDRLAYDIGGAQGEALWRRLFYLASDVHASVIRAESSTPLEERSYSPDIEYRVVPTPPASSPLRETLTLIKKGSHYFVECRTHPFSADNPEERLSLGCEALFVHLFNSGSAQQKFFLPIVTMAQCNWYQENGLPRVTQITAAPYQGSMLMQQLLSSEG